MGHGYKHGANGSSLNFTVKTYPSETELKADKPRENTIGIITTTTMTSWVFSAKEPTEPQVGMVWITLGTASTAEFNALHNNKLQVYPISVKQYEGGAWVDKTAYSYQGGEWKQWSEYLYNKGNVFDGWEAKALRPNEGWQALLPTLTLNADNMYIKQAKNQGGNESGIVRYVKDIDLTAYSKLCVDFSGKSSGNSTVGTVSLHVIGAEDRDLDEYAKSGNDKRLANKTLVSVNTEVSRKTEQIDISNIDKSCNIAFCIGVNNGTTEINVYSIWAE